ncbi:MAG: chromosomal replication initiator protein DnaA [bacterium]
MLFADGKLRASRPVDPDARAPGLPRAAADDGAHGLWTQVLEFLKSRINKEGYETWLAPTKGWAVSDDALEVSVPNGFFADWISQHYAANVREALVSISGRDLKLSFRARDATDAASLRRPSAVSPRPGGDNGARLHGRYTFSNFVVGENSRFATAAAHSVAERLGVAYNPLFLYGGVGLGKTHLLQAIGNHALTQNPRLKVHYVPAETLFLELIQAIEKNSRLEFKQRYRVLDLLLLDDVHYLVGKERLQEEVFHIFNHLNDAGSQVVFTSDRPPREIPTLEDRLVSRLGSGLVVDVQAPDLETRVAILKQKAALEDRELSHEVALYVAARIRASVRELEGCLVRILALASLTGRPITTALAEEATRGLVDVPTLPDGNAIVAATADAFGVTVADLRGPRRTKQLALARQVAMYLLRKTLSMSLKEVGYCLGGKDHTTVMYAVEKIDKLRITNLELDARILRLTAGINRG